MRLYRTSVIGGPTSKWSGSQAEAAKHRGELVSAGRKRSEIETMEVDIPTTKKELIKWLTERSV